MAARQRRAERKAVRVEFRGRDSGGAGELLFEGADLSSGGTFLQSDLLLEDGEALVLSFRLPGVERAVTAEARVAWARRFPKEGEPAGMGVEFLTMRSEDRAALASFLASLEK